MQSKKFLIKDDKVICFPIEIKIRELRKKAEIELGSSFDIREFHEVVLEQGTVTLSILENRVNNYIEDHNNE